MNIKILNNSKPLYGIIIALSSLLPLRIGDHFLARRLGERGGWGEYEKRA